MSNYKLTILSVLVFVAPPFFYFMTNFYWWLFDGNHPIASKMSASIAFLLLGCLITVGIGAAEESVINKDNS